MSARSVGIDVTTSTRCEGYGLHYDSRMKITSRCSLVILLSIPVVASDLVEGDFKSSLVPNPVPYAVLMPDGAKDGPPLPLLIYLHGGGGSRAALTTVRGVFDEL